MLQHVGRRTDGRTQGRTVGRTVRALARGGTAAGVLLAVTGAVVAVQADRTGTAPTGRPPAVAALGAAVPARSAPAAPMTAAELSEETAVKASAARVAAARAAVAETARQRAAAAEKASRDAQRDPRTAARGLLAEHGWGDGQFRCLDALWTKESGWRATARNPSSGAFGIPQALPAAKLASAGADWRTNPVTQIRWGLTYIDDVYGSPCAAWAHSRAANWY